MGLGVLDDPFMAAPPGTVSITTNHTGIQRHHD